TLQAVQDLLQLGSIEAVEVGAVDRLDGGSDWSVETLEHCFELGRSQAVELGQWKVRHIYADRPMRHRSQPLPRPANPYCEHDSRRRRDPGDHPTKAPAPAVALRAKPAKHPLGDVVDIEVTRQLGSQAGRHRHQLPFSLTVGAACEMSLFLDA